MEQELITFAKVKERLEGKSLEEYTDEDMFDRYIAYRNRGRIKHT